MKNKMKPDRQERWGIFVKKETFERFKKLAQENKRTYSAQFEIILEEFLKSLQEKI